MMRLQIMLILFCFLLLIGCQKNAKQSNIKTFTVQAAEHVNALFYSGIIEPIASRVVPSPADGVIVAKAFQNGDKVINNQLLFKIASSKFLIDYKAALLAYVKAKNEFNTNKTQLAEYQFLHKNQLISDDAYKEKQSSFYASQLTLLQAKDALEVFLKQMDIKNIDYYQLTIADIDKITQAIHMQQGAQYLRVLAPQSGIILASLKNAEEGKKLHQGDAVKEGDVLALIADMQGLAVRIKVSELTVNQIKVGDKVKVTGIAFPNQTLLGKIKEIDRQGEASMNGLPTFPVVVEVQHLSATQQKIIHVGMSAKVEIDLADKQFLYVPLAAVHQANGKPYVLIINNETKDPKQQWIETGKTTRTQVAVINGLKAGDELVLS